LKLIVILDTIYTVKWYWRYHGWRHKTWHVDN